MSLRYERSLDAGMRVNLLVGDIVEMFPCSDPAWCLEITRIWFTK